jgi:hypothetical protein
MSRQLPVTQRQAQALLRAAEAENAIIEVKIGEVLYRLIPASHAKAQDRLVDGKEDFRL